MCVFDKILFVPKNSQLDLISKNEKKSICHVTFFCHVTFLSRDFLKPRDFLKSRDFFVT